MTKAKVDRFRAVTARVAELGRVAHHRDAIMVQGSDPLDEVRAASQRFEGNQLREARAALRRIEEDSFGTCRQCDEDILPRRLTAAPWPPFFRRCPAAVDRNRNEIQPPTSHRLGLAA